MHDSRDSSYLDSVLDFPSVVSDDEGRLHDSGELDVAVSFMLTLELVQQGLIGSLRETAKTLISSGSHSKSLKTKVDTLWSLETFLSSDYFRKIKNKLQTLPPPATFFPHICFPALLKRSSHSSNPKRLKLPVTYLIP